MNRVKIGVKTNDYMVYFFFKHECNCFKIFVVNTLDIMCNSISIISSKSYKKVKHKSKCCKKKILKHLIKCFKCGKTSHHLFEISCVLKKNKTFADMS